MTGTLHALETRIVVKTIEPYNFELTEYPLHPQDINYNALSGINGVPVEFQIVELDGIKYATLNERSAKVYGSLGS